MKRSLPISQIVILILSFVCGILFVAHWRTQFFGMTWRGLAGDAVVLFAVLPIAVLGVLGLPWRKASPLLFALCIGMIGWAEIYTGVQEWLVVRRYGENPGREIFVNRWPPYGNHFIGYSPGYGWLGGD
jgi:hypothetical protein